MKIQENVQKNLKVTQGYLKRHFKELVYFMVNSQLLVGQQFFH